MRLTPLTRGILLGWSAIVLVCYFSTHPLSAINWPSLLALLQCPTGSAVGSAFAGIFEASVLVATMILFGRALWVRFQLPPAGPFEECLIGAGLGAGSFMACLFLLGILGCWEPLWFRGLFAMAIIVGVYGNRTWLQKLMSWRPEAAVLSVWPAWDLFLAAALFVFLNAYGIQALAPEISYDSLVYHLAVPQQWLVHHRIIPTPDCVFSGIPFNMELLYGMALSLSGEGLAKLLHFACGAGTLGVLYLLTKRYASRAAALTACLIFISPPMIALEFGRTSIDLASTFFAALSIYALVRAVESPTGVRSRWVFLSGIFCGLTMGTKYIVWVLPPALLAALWLSEIPRRRGRMAPVRLAFVFSLPAFIVVLPWLVKNASFFGDPFYPFFRSLFPQPGGSLSNWESLRSEAARPLTDLATWRGLWAYVSDPWRATMSGKSDHNFMGPLFLLFLPWLALLRGSAGRLKPLIHVFLGLWVLSSLPSYLPRFWMLALMVLSVLIGIGISQAADGLQTWARGFLVVSLLADLCWGTSFMADSEGWKVVWGLTAKSDYLNTTHRSYNGPYYRAAEFLNHETAPEAGVLMLGDFRSFYVQRPCWAASAYNTPPIFALANASLDGDDLYSRLKARGITHILFNAAAVVPGSRYWKVIFTPEGRQVFDAFWRRHTLKLFEDQDLSPGAFRSAFVYELVDDRRALRPHAPEEPSLLLQIMDALAKAR